MPFILHLGGFSPFTFHSRYLPSRAHSLAETFLLQHCNIVCVWLLSTHPMVLSDPPPQPSDTVVSCFSFFLSHLYHNAERVRGSLKLQGGTVYDILVATLFMCCCHPTVRMGQPELGQLNWPALGHSSLRGFKPILSGSTAHTFFFLHFMLPNQYQALHWTVGLKTGSSLFSVCFIMNYRNPVR